MNSAASPQPATLCALAERARVVFFDCDGVLLDSNRVKLDAVAHALHDLPADLRRACLDSFRRNFGMPRLKHFERFHQIVSDPLQPLQAFIEHRMSAYVEHLRARYHLSPAACGAVHLVRQLKLRGAKCYVITGGVEAEARHALDHAGFAGLFDGMAGAPVAKDLAMQHFLAAHDCPASESLFFGDAIADRDAAWRAGLPFVFVSRYAFVDLEHILEGWPPSAAACHAVFDLGVDQPVQPCFAAQRQAASALTL